MRQKEEIYEVANPRWLADTFVFQKKQNGEQVLICYIKVNHHNKIEEIGPCFDERFHFLIEDYPLVLNRKDVQIATPAHRRRFISIDDEYWFGLWNNLQYQKRLASHDQRRSH